jgi:hypothetical protein
MARAAWPGDAFQFEMRRDQAFEFAAILLAATQQSKPKQTINKGDHLSQTRAERRRRISYPGQSCKWPKEIVTVKVGDPC